MFDEDRVVAVTGADMSPTLNDEPAPTWTAFQVETDDELSFEFATEIEAGQYIIEIESEQ